MTLEFSLTPPSPASRPRVCEVGGCVRRGEEAGKRLRSPSHWGRRLPPRARPPTSPERSQEPHGREVLFTPTAATALANCSSVTRPLRHSSPGFPVLGLLTSRDAPDGPVSLAR